MTYLEKELRISEQIQYYLFIELQNNSDKFSEYASKLQNEEVFAKSLTVVIKNITNAKNIKQEEI